MVQSGVCLFICLIFAVFRRILFYFIFIFIFLFFCSQKNCLAGQVVPFQLSTQLSSDSFKYFEEVQWLDQVGIKECPSTTDGKQCLRCYWICVFTSRWWCHTSPAVCTFLPHESPACTTQERNHFDSHLNSLSGYYTACPHWAGIKVGIDACSWCIIHR